eukprot:gene12524-biopygen3031
MDHYSDHHRCSYRPPLRRGPAAQRIAPQRRASPLRPRPRRARGTGGGEKWVMSRRAPPRWLPVRGHGGMLLGPTDGTNPRGLAPSVGPRSIPPWPRTGNHRGGAAAPAPFPFPYPSFPARCGADSAYWRSLGGTWTVFYGAIEACPRASHNN